LVILSLDSHKASLTGGAAAGDEHRSSPPELVEACFRVSAMLSSSPWKTRIVSVSLSENMKRSGAHVFEAAEIQIREQILDPCLLLGSGLRDYEIKLDRRISAARESLQLFLFGN
jgi:hypothetical protein